MGAHRNVIIVVIHLFNLEPRWHPPYWPPHGTVPLRSESRSSCCQLPNLNRFNHFDVPRRCTTSCRLAVYATGALTVYTYAIITTTSNLHVAVQKPTVGVLLVWVIAVQHAPKHCGSREHRERQVHNLRLHACPKTWCVISHANHGRTSGSHHFTTREYGHIVAQPGHILCNMAISACF